MLPDAKMLLEKVVVNGDIDLVAENIRQGVNIFGVSGTLKSIKIASGDQTVTAKRHATISVDFLTFRPKIVIAHTTNYIGSGYSYETVRYRDLDIYNITSRVVTNSQDTIITFNSGNTFEIEHDTHDTDKDSNTYTFGFRWVAIGWD